MASTKASAPDETCKKQEINSCYQSILSWIVNTLFRKGLAPRSNGSHQAIQSDAVRVNANLFQTDLCRKTRMAGSNHIPVIWIPAAHAGMTSYFCYE